LLEVNQATSIKLFPCQILNPCWISNLCSFESVKQRIEKQDAST